MAPALVVLVVEDDPLVREIVVWEMADAGFEIVEAGSGDEALDILKRDQHIDVLFTDIRMPGTLDGWDLAERARELRPDLPVVYASGFSPKAAREVEGSLFVMKPYNAAALITAIQRVAGSAAV